MPASMLGPLRPSVFRFKLGDFEVTSFHDGSAVRENPANFGVNQPPEAVTRFLEENHLPTDKFENSYSVVAVNTGSQVILFDVGNGERRRSGGVGNLRPLMLEHGPKPEEVDLVVIGHCHPDHIGGLVEGGEPAFPNAEIAFGRTEFDFWLKGEGVSEARKATYDLFTEIAAPLANQARFLDPDEEVVEGVTAVDVAGHSPGQLAFLIESAGERLLIWGDVANHYVVSLGNPDWHFGMDDDRDKAVVTRKRICDWVAREGLLVSGYHMPFPALGYLDRDGDGYRWVPAGYQLTF